MAELRVEGSDLVLHLSAAEKAEGVHGDLRAAVLSVRGVEVLDDAHGAAQHGAKIGTRIPGIIEVGTIQGMHERLFAVVHKNTPRGLRVTIDGGSYDGWIVGSQAPESVAAQLSQVGVPAAR